MHDDLFRMTDTFSDPFSPAGLRVNSAVDLPHPPAGLRWSSYLWASSSDGWVALYRPLNLGLLYFPVQRGLGSLDNHQLSVLKRESFLIPAEGDHETQEHNSLIARAQSGTFRFICILPTTQCPLRCLYCHQKPPPRQAKTMSVTELVTGLKKCAELCTNLEQPVDILLYGGEPLRAFHLTEKLLQLTTPPTSIFRQPVRRSFTTSGYGLDESRAELLARHNVFVILSVDGPPEVNDAIRQVGTRKSAFALAERAYALLKAHGCRVGLSVTIGTHNFNGFKDHLEWLLQRFQPDDIGLNAFLHRVDTQPNPFQLDSDQAFEALSAGLELTNRYSVYAEQPFRRLKPFVWRTPLVKDCSAGGERLVLAPGGVMGFCDSCYPDHRAFYPLDQFPQAAQSDLQVWSHLSSPEMPECRICPAMTVCGGACRYDAYKASGRLEGVDPLRCRFELKFLNWMIWELFRRAGQGKIQSWFPTEQERALLFDNITLTTHNQPFTAGSLVP